jgi:glycine/D-amino acid oxidase-like deaminating enzyme
LSGEFDFDSVVIGGGITGLTTAYLLKRSGHKVAVLEKDTVGGGTTGRTTGKLTSQHGLIYEELSERLGPEQARLYAEANHAAVSQVAAIIRSEKIDCGLSRQDNYVFTADPSQAGRFKREARTARFLGLPASFETSSPLPFAIAGAVRFSGQYRIDAQRYALGLAAAIHGDGSRVFESTRATRFKDGPSAWVRARGGAVKARSVVIATNVPTLPLAARGTYCWMEYPMESYIIAGLLPKPLKDMYISPDKDHYSILPIMHDGRHMVLIGGQSHISGLRGSRKHRYRRLASYAAGKFGVTDITHHWSDRDYLSYDYLPLAGKLYPWSRNLYVATAFRKWGLSNGTASAMALCGLITGRPVPWTAAFRPHRARSAAYIPRTAAKHLF